MTTINHPKTWLTIAILALLLTCMLIIIKHYNADKELQQKIYDHSEIIDTA
ncbi:MAG TPA: hypothetical protein VIM16_20170 [Mucilaginibacter sp.]|jgi:hypothetical protein